MPFTGEAREVAQDLDALESSLRRLKRLVDSTAAFVDDVVEALLTVAPCEVGHGQVFNLGGDQVVSLGDLAARMVRIHGRGSCNVREFPAERKAIDIGDYYSDFGRIRETFGWQPRTSLDDALARTIEFYRENLPRSVA